MNECVEWWNNSDGKTKVLREKSVTVPLLSPQITNGLAWFQTQASLVRGW
jgi:hypothetical protein